MLRRGFAWPWLWPYRAPGSSTRPAAESAHRVEVKLVSPMPVGSVSSEYLSFSIDISVLAGGYWWEGSTGIRRGLGNRRVAPLNLNQDKLDRLVQHLGPAYLRIGGSEADKIHYFSAPDDEPDALVLTQAMWDELQAFVQRHRLRLAFTFKYGLFQRKQHGQWCTSEVERLLRYSCERGYRLDVCELGNELNAYWAFHGVKAQPSAKHLAADYQRFAETVKSYLPEARIIGPGSAFWPRLGETFAPFSNLTRKFLLAGRNNQCPVDIVDWHYYPFQSLRAPLRTRTATTNAMLRPAALNDFRKYSDKLRQWRDDYAPNAELWTGETGSAQCGGQPKLSDRFASCFWWADQLGLAATLGYQVMIRQSLIGGDYGLIDRQTLKPRPDYWLSWLWQQLMGPKVFPVANPRHLLRTYCHNTPGGSGRTLMLINLSARPIALEPIGFGELRRQYLVTAKHLQSKKLRINGKKARFRGGDFALTDFPSPPLTHTLPGHSISFWLFED